MQEKVTESSDLVSAALAGQGIGLALSGGGFRATLFHLGALWRLNELGLLGQLERIVGISGGSILAGYVGLRWNSLLFHDGVATNFQTEIVNGIRKFCSKNIDRQTYMLRVLPKPWAWRRAGNALDYTYREQLFGDALLADLPDTPVIIFGATNLLSGAPFSFRKSHAGDYRFGRMLNPPFRVSEAVAASSAFPPIFSPFRLKVEPHWFIGDDTADFQKSIPGSLYLSDGGVIDNLGLDYLWKRNETVLISDSGAPPQFEKRVTPRWLTLTKRALDIAIYQSEPMRRRMLIKGFADGLRKGAYWSIDAPMTDWYSAEGMLPCDRNLITALARMRTRLNRFSDAEQSLLINWGYAVSDAAIRFHLLKSGQLKKPIWPYEDYPLDRPGFIQQIIE